MTKGQDVEENTREIGELVLESKKGDLRRS